MAKQYSIDPGTKNTGGDLGTFDKKRMVAPFANAAFALPLNTVSDPVKTQYGWHVIEHLKTPVHAMQELWRVAKPGAACYLRCPYGSSDDAFEDPTHVRQYFINSFGYFSQPFYWRADYGYRGDWKPELIQLTVSKEIKPMGLDRLREMVHTQRNVVQEMGVKLVAVKPARQPKAELQTPFDIRFNFV